jgi:DNA primase
MMISKATIDAAKHADLPGILSQLGIELVQNCHGYHFRQHDSLKLFQKNGIWLYKWWSRAGEVGDGIQYLQRHLGMTFQEAVATLSGSSMINHAKNHWALPQPWLTENWQRSSQKLIQAAMWHLWRPHGKECFLYLVNQRGLYPQTILKHRLGWLPQNGHMPAKLLIPSYNSQGQLIRIRFRIDKPQKDQERYRIRKGSNSCAPFPISIRPGKPIIIIESDLDAILIAQEAGVLTGILSLGTTGSKLTPAMIRFINKNIPLTMIGLDNDEAGKVLTTRLLKELSKAVNWPVPLKYGKDPGEAWKTMDIRKWIEQGIKEHRDNQSRVGSPT